MQMTVEEVAQAVPVTILALKGDLDATNFEEVITRVRKLYNEGTRHLLLDLTEMAFMSSSGLVALHSIAMLLRGEPPPDLEAGWEVFHDIDRQRGSGGRSPVKLLNPQPKVAQTLRVTGFHESFEIYDDRKAALDSF